MGDWWIEKEMEMVNEKVWLHKTKVHNFVQSYSYIDKLYAHMVNGLHIWSQGWIVAQPYDHGWDEDF
jgi:hypothetical protein